MRCPCTALCWPESVTGRRMAKSSPRPQSEGASCRPRVFSSGSARPWCAARVPGLLPQPLALGHPPPATCDSSCWRTARPTRPEAGCPQPRGMAEAAQGTAGKSASGAARGLLQPPANIPLAYSEGSCSYPPAPTPVPTGGTRRAARTPTAAPTGRCGLHAAEDGGPPFLTGDG